MSDLVMNTKENKHSLIAARLRLFRKTRPRVMGDREETQKEFATRHNFNPGQYQMWESGARRIPIECAEVLEDLYGLSLDYIYLGRVQKLPFNLIEEMGLLNLEK